MIGLLAVVLWSRDGCSLTETAAPVAATPPKPQRLARARFSRATRASRADDPDLLVALLDEDRQQDALAC